MNPSEFYADGGILAVRGGTPAFVLPEGFVRKSEFHMTLLDIEDSKRLRAVSGQSGRAYEAWLSGIVATNGVPDGSPVFVGVGRVEQGENAAYFEVWVWPEAQAWRAAMNLPPKDLHITIGVRGSDVHGVAKDHTTLVPEPFSGWDDSIGNLL